MFTYQKGELFAEKVSVSEIAQLWGTPCYIYSRAALLQAWKAFNSSHRICYAVKANSNLAILNLFARWGAGFDIVSVGELERVVAAGGDPEKVIFSGVGKRHDEMERALELNIDCFNVESKSELIQLNAVAGQMRKRAPVALRINPDISADTHPYISTGLKENKFGIDIQDARALYQFAHQLPNIQIRGIAFHIGSQITELQPFVDALKRCLNLVDELAADGIVLQAIDVGGGLGVAYQSEKIPSPSDYTTAILELLKKYPLQVIFSPGRALTAHAGILVTRVEVIKNNFAIVDAAMNDFLRPALYDAFHTVTPVKKQSGILEKIYDVVGPVCETGDFLAKSQLLAIQENDLLTVHTAGAYGFVMSSNYNSRGRAAEILVDGSDIHLIRPRETIQDLFAMEKII